MAALLWIVFLGAGSLLVVRFETRAAEAGNVPVQWPGESRIARDGRPAVLMFLHPNCPCSKASVHELTAVVQALSPGESPRVVFVLRTEAGHDWRTSALRRQAAAVPGATLLEDDGGREAGRFGARTSGVALLYDAAGTLRFQGGITAARGHEGANAAEDRLIGLLQGSSKRAAATPVYGCSLEKARPRAMSGVKPCPI